MLEAYPGHGILAEESGREHGAQAQRLRLDHRPAGRHHQLHPRLPACTRSRIALAFKGKIEQAVVYDPSRNDLFYATKGRGAYLNDRRIRVSKRTRLADCLIGTGFPFRPGDNFKSYMTMHRRADAAHSPACAARVLPRSTCATSPPAGTTASSRPA